MNKIFKIFSVSLVLIFLSLTIISFLNVLGHPDIKTLPFVIHNQYKVRSIFKLDGSEYTDERIYKYTDIYNIIKSDSSNYAYLLALDEDHIFIMKFVSSEWWNKPQESTDPHIQFDYGTEKHWVVNLEDGKIIYSAQFPLIYQTAASMYSMHPLLLSNDKIYFDNVGLLDLKTYNFSPIVYDIPSYIRDHTDFRDQNSDLVSCMFTYSPYRGYEWKTTDTNPLNCLSVSSQIYILSNSGSRLDSPLSNPQKVLLFEIPGSSTSLAFFPNPHWFNSNQYDEEVKTLINRNNIIKGDILNWPYNGHYQDRTFTVKNYSISMKKYNPTFDFCACNSRYTVDIFNIDGKRLGGYDTGEFPELLSLNGNLYSRSYIIDLNSLTTTNKFILWWKTLEKSIFYSMVILT